MHPSAPDRPTNVGGGRCKLDTTTVLFLLSLGFLPSMATCPTYCLCASDIISCSGHNLSALPFELPGYATRLDLSHNSLAALHTHWVSQTFERLTTLVLSKNFINLIGVNAFNVTPHLHFLDLSSNQLTALNSSVFVGLSELKELLLFANKINQIDSGAFHGLRSLQRLYLSTNRLTTFPLGVYEERGGPRNLTFLDLSYNKLSTVPVQSLLSLTHQGGIYLQENPLVCDCAVVALMEYWMWKQYSPFVDYKGEYPCRGGAEEGLSCHQEEVLGLNLEPQTYQVDPGKWLRVPCPGLALPVQEGQVVFWVTPRLALNTSTTDPSAHLAILSNGTLEIRGTVREDSGTYACVVARRHHYGPGESLEVTVVVGNMSTVFAHGSKYRSSAENFNTAFTTLASCVVSIILVLLYLYLTPCHFWNSRGSRRCGGRAIALCSDPREVEAGHLQSNGKRVAFLEPQAEDSEGDSIKLSAMTPAHGVTEGILKNGNKPVGEALPDTGHMA
ncbi:amphoterin-induced protein 2-like [Pholidichthys leucotaenia]